MRGRRSSATPVIPALRSRATATRVALLTLAGGLVFGSTACSRSRGPVSRTWTCMGTFASLTVSANDEAALDAAAALAEATLQDLDSRLSIYKPDSEISRLNRAAGQTPVPVSERTEEMLRLSRYYADATGNAFDSTVAPLVQLWGFSGGAPLTNVPDRATLDAALERVGHHRLLLTNHTAFLDREGMLVDLGGIAKGYAVDVCYRELAAGRGRNLMVNLGGNLRCRGEAAPGRAWSIGVRNPFHRDRIIGVLRLADGMAVATSGNYENFAMIDGKRYTHIVNPRTGWPVEGMASVTVLAATAVEADAMSTAVFVLGVKDSLPVLRRMPDCRVIVIPDEQPIRAYLLPGVREFFTPDPSFDGEFIDIAWDAAGAPPPQTP